MNQKNYCNAGNAGNAGNGEFAITVTVTRLAIAKKRAITVLLYILYRIEYNRRESPSPQTPYPPHPFPLELPLWGKT